MSDKRDIQNVQSCGYSGPGLKTTVSEYYMKTETMTILFVIFLSSIHDILIRTQVKSESSILPNSVREVLFKASYTVIS